MGGLGLIAGAVAASGGARSPAWVYTVLRRGVRGVLLSPRDRLRLPDGVRGGAGAGVRCTTTGRPAERPWPSSLISSAAIVAIGGAIVAGRQLLAAFRARAELLAAEQGALRRVATAVVEGHPPEQIYELVAREAAALLGAGAAGIIRFDGENAGYGDGLVGRPRGRPLSTRHGDRGQARERRRARAGNPPAGTDRRASRRQPGGPLGYTASIVSPVKVGGRSWGALAVTAAEPVRLTADDEQQLLEFGDLLATRDHEHRRPCHARRTGGSPTR